MYSIKFSIIKRIDLYFTSSLSSNRKIIIYNCGHNFSSLLGFRFTATAKIIGDIITPYHYDYCESFLKTLNM